MNEHDELERLKQIVLTASNWSAPVPNEAMSNELTPEQAYRQGWEKAWTHYRQTLKRLAFPEKH